MDEVELVLGLKERGRLFLKAGTEVGGGEGGGVSLWVHSFKGFSNSFSRARSMAIHGLLDRCHVGPLAHLNRTLQLVYAMPSEVPRRSN